ncbi:MAG: hypothetical protein U0235_32660 [Polyangiaceae bacterium]
MRPDVPHRERAPCARLRVVPGGASGPRASPPAALPSAVVIDKGGSLARVTRDLAPRRHADSPSCSSCPMLSASLPREGDDLVARLETCLELLIELRGEADVVIEWLEGDATPALVRDSKQVRVRVSGDTSWLSVNGEVTVDDGRVVQMTELLKAASRRGRSCRSATTCVALTDELRKKLDALTRCPSLGKGGRVPGAALVMTACSTGWMSRSRRSSRPGATRSSRTRDLAVPCRAIWPPSSATINARASSSWRAAPRLASARASPTTWVSARPCKRSRSSCTGEARPCARRRADERRSQLGG